MENRRFKFKLISFSKIICIFLFYLLLIVIFSFLFYEHSNTKPQILVSPNIVGCLSNHSTFQKALARQREGLPLARFANDTLDLTRTLSRIPLHFNRIWNDYLKMLDHLELLSDDSGEIKYFIKFSISLSRPYNCFVLTLGVGRLIWAETNMSKIYPECRFLAADASAKVNEALIKQELHGTFVKTAIGGETIERSVSNIITYKNSKAARGKKIGSQLGISDFLWRYNSKTPIDLLSIDVEGAEFGILKEFAYNFESFPMPICQFNVEVHHHNLLASYEKQIQFTQHLDHLLRFGQFALLRTDAFAPDSTKSVYHRMFFVNVLNEICVQKYLC